MSEGDLSIEYLRLDIDNELVDVKAEYLKELCLKTDNRCWR